MCKHASLCVRACEISSIHLRSWEIDFVHFGAQNKKNGNTLMLWVVVVVFFCSHTLFLDQGRQSVSDDDINKFKALHLNEFSTINFFSIQQRRYFQWNNNKNYLTTLQFKVPDVNSTTFQINHFKNQFFYYRLMVNVSSIHTMRIKTNKTINVRMALLFKRNKKNVLNIFNKLYETICLDCCMLHYLRQIVFSLLFWLKCVCKSIFYAF